MIGGAARMPLLIGAAIAAVALMVTCVFILRAMSRQEKLTARMSNVLGSVPGTIEPLFTGGVFAKLQPEKKTAKQRIVDIFGVHLERAVDYPVRWYVVIIVALPLSRLVAGLASTIIGDWFVFATPLIWIFASRTFFSWAEERRRITLFRQFPDALAMVVRAVRVGIPLTDAIAGAGRESPQPTAREFQGMSDRIAIGMQIQEAVTDTALRNGVAEYRFFATAIALQASTGGSPTEALDNLADVIRKRVALQERGKALASQARSSAVVLAILPVATALLLLVIDFDYMSLLFTDNTGRQILGASITLLCLGMFTMRTIIKKSLA
ncbi:type II secretion system F family protein [Plastoroseomonas arctica]|uniref:Type II secretion system protein GspF domain-containing protein n=1 Tax=Plastoroseomonas arctica TaxID=1509237 RepID=A0AAF1JY13_9PROT|nr:hypothetical protein [Plastoroseomonas arctica]